MSNQYKKDYFGAEVLELVHDDSVSIDVSVEDKQVTFFSSYDKYESNCISLNVEDWEEVKLFIDKKIINSMGLEKSLLGEH